MTPPRLSRRNYLALTATAGSAVVAGCSASLQGDASDLEIEPLQKSFSDSLWESVDTTELRFQRTGLSATAAARTYRNTRVKKAIEKRFPGGFHRSLTVAFGIRLAYEGLGSSVVRASDILNELSPEIQDRLKEQGITDITEIDTGTVQQVKPPKQALGDAYKEFTGKATVPKQREELELGRFGKQMLTFSRQELPMRILLFVRDLTAVGLEGKALVLGGVYPTDNYTNKASTVLREVGDESITLEVRVDSGFNIRSLRRDLVNGYIKQILTSES